MVERPVRRWRVLAWFIGLLVAGWLAASGFAAHALTARPRAPRAEVAPEDFEVESLRLTSADGVELGAWFHAGTPGRALVLLVHGMDGSRSSMEMAMRRLAARGHGSLAVTLRGFGDSEGDRLDFGIHAREDVLAASAALESRAGGAPLVVIGQSLGAAATLFAARELGARVAGYVLEAPYLTLEKACRDRLALRLPPVLDELAFRGLALWTPLFLPADFDEIRPIDACVELPTTARALFVAGSQDLLAPSADVRAMSLAARAPSEFVELAGRSHEDLWELDEQHLALWLGFLERIERERR